MNAPFWVIHLYVCDDVLIEGVTVAAPVYSRNTDCIDPDSSTNIVIRNCTLSGGDDQVAIKSGQDEAGRLFGKPSINITVEDIHCMHGDVIYIGSEMSGGVSNVVVRNVKFNDVLHPMRIKTGYGRGGTVKNVLFENIVLATLGQACGTGITVDDSMVTFSKMPATQKTVGQTSIRLFFATFVAVPLPRGCSIASQNFLART